MNIFSYESKFSEILMFVADLAILNLCFILSCLPIFTIGAAQAALYTAVRAINDPEDDRPPRQVFFSVFKDGFKSITLAWLAFFVVEILLVFSITYASRTVNTLTFWISIAAIILVMLLHAQIPLFHSRFSCTAGQLIRNSFFLCLAHPLRAILTAALLWAPAVLFFWNIGLFMPASLAVILIYYAVIFLLNFIIMKKPFRTLIDHYHETHDAEGFPILPNLDEEETEDEEDAF